MYENVHVYDVASMHPTSIVQLNAFGRYTPKFEDLLDARVAIKRGELDRARQMLDGKLEPYLSDPKDAKQLAYALKIVINIVYGLTSAKFDNPFRDLRNKDNIIAKRGALFMMELRRQVQERGGKVVHIKTDSIKVVDPTPELTKFIFQFGEQYGYEFEHEHTYEKFCLVDKAQYIAKIGWSQDESEIGKWTPTGALFQHPYIFKTLFSKDEVNFSDLCETKQVAQGEMYLDLEPDRPSEKSGTEGLKFVGRTGRFTPVQEGQHGGILYRVKDDKRYKVTGTSGHLWIESEIAEETQPHVDMSYFLKLQDTAIAALAEHGDPAQFCDGLP